MINCIDCGCDILGICTKKYCKDCKKKRDYDSHKRWRENNRQECIDRAVLWQETYPEKKKENDQRYKKENVENHKKYMRKYRKEKSEKFKAYKKKKVKPDFKEFFPSISLERKREIFSKLLTREVPK
jgi:hypothetical protein